MKEFFGGFNNFVDIYFHIIHVNNYLLENRTQDLKSQNLDIYLIGLKDGKYSARGLFKNRIFEFRFTGNFYKVRL